MNRLDVGCGGIGRILPRIMVPALFVLALFAALLLRRPDQTPSRVDVELELEGRVFGTTYSVRLVPATEPDARRLEVLERSVAGALDAVDVTMSTWRPDSELQRFNRSDTQAFAASPALLEVIAAAADVSQRSEGAFDVTVGPLVEAWGFGSRPVIIEPDPAALAALRAATGWHLLEIDPVAGTLRKRQPELAIDLSAIAKGYAVDRVGAALEGLGESRFMVEVGGEVVVRGLAPGDRPWRLGIETPDEDRQAVYAVVALRDGALATSGDYRNFRIDAAGRRLSHTIDPRTGRPIDHDMASVSVIAPTCLEADAWATALNVLGPEKGLLTAAREGLAALFIERGPDGALLEHATPGFAVYRTVAPPRGGDQP